MNWFWFFKLMHLGGIIMWIGPPLGAYWMYLRSFRRTSGNGQSNQLETIVERRVRGAFIGILLVEHIGFALLLLGMLGMLWAGDWVHLKLSWVQWKLCIVVAIFFPLEFFDIWWGQIAPQRAMRNDPGPGIGTELRRILNRYDLFVKISIPFLIPAWIVIFYLAVARPAWPPIW
ncbi:MAG: hypothetical protein KDK34_24225 [Leptospiraceae bacterium]|nr:hypothetical protein [Leptospiraceae bacterium]